MNEIIGSPKVIYFKQWRDRILIIFFISVILGAFPAFIFTFLGIHDYPFFLPLFLISAFVTTGLFIWKDQLGYITIQIDNSPIELGETVRGTFLLRINKSIDSKSLTVKATGTRYICHGRQSKYTYPIFIQEKVISTEQRFLSSTPVPVYNFEFTIPKDVYEKWDEQRNKSFSNTDIEYSKKIRVFNNFIAGPCHYLPEVDDWRIEVKLQTKWLFQISQSKQFLLRSNE